MEGKLFVVVFDNMQWEDIKIFEQSSDAVNFIDKIKKSFSKTVQSCHYRIEVFEKNEKNMFIPSYDK